ncbi:Dehydrogenase/reductase SDR family member 12 isoform 1 [Schistosoma japonicum]|uniref:Dehydrogenase/reductase SDR family member 12 isoform 1 n=1 Tax=Schistosoma japonicum TaxID=6182 RepID=A0A4Z2CZS6_SCHJA|nr:Dehydrogenase/reductase SDR family member 12 isoform 1 [Schistosoma japonicum]
MINWLAIAFSGILGFGLLSVISSVIMSLFRNLAWFSKGMREYTKSGYESAASKFDPNELTGVRIDGTRVLVTGANSGIGLVCCKELARHGARIHMVCRNKSRAEEARQEIISETGVNESLIIIHLLDLSKPNDVHSFGKQFANNNDSRLDILINNAGCMINEYKTDENGIEANFATNTLGTYILTECLIPALKKSPDAVALSMPSFYNKMKNKLRTPEQGADTVIWLALVPNVRRYPNGSFFQDRHVVSQHLKLGCTQSTDYEKQRFMSNLADIAAPFFK